MRVRLAFVAFAAFGVLAAAVGAYVAWHRIVPDLPLGLPVSSACVVSAGTTDGTPVSLDVRQMANAATISAVGLRRGVPRRAVVVALATAWQESKITNLPDGDRDSIGLFQQRPSQGWGRPEQIADPRYAANRFYSRLLQVRGWEKIRVTEAAQAVQRSAYPEAYEKWAAKSEVLARALVGEATGAVACMIPGEPSSRGAAAAQQLAASLRLDWGEVRTVSATDIVGVTLAVRDSKAAWQYAHWLVAHAEDRGVKRVRYADREWTAKKGEWTQTAPPAPSDHVVAEVY